MCIQFVDFDRRWRHCHLTGHDGLHLSIIFNDCTLDPVQGGLDLVVQIWLTLGVQTQNYLDRTVDHALLGALHFGSHSIAQLVFAVSCTLRGKESAATAQSWPALGYDL